MDDLGCADVAAYRARLEDDPDEWRVLDGLFRITISHFYRDRHVFDALRDTVLPELVQRAKVLRCFSAGCASGEEPYTVSLIWHLTLAARFPLSSISIVATDNDRNVLSRARRACYPVSSLRDLPPGMMEEAFAPANEELCLKERFREDVGFQRQDIRRELPEGSFDLILCRNLVFTYFEPSLQKEIGTRLVAKLMPGGALVVGARETPTNGALEPWLPRSGIYRKTGSVRALTKDCEAGGSQSRSQRCSK